MSSRSLRPPDDAQDPENVALRQARLTFFLTDRLLPVLRPIAALDTFTSGRRSFLQAELLESFLWLHHGMEIAYFSLPLARRVTYEHFHLFLNAYESVASSIYFETWFTPPLRAIW